MKTRKTILSIAFLALSMMLSLSLNAQWETKYYVDDFGDPTDQSYETFLADGKFSNSATINSDAMYHFVKDENGLVVYVYEYKSRKATNINDVFTTVKIKTPSGKVKTFDKILFSKKGYLYFNEIQTNELVETLKEKGDYTMVFSYVGKYSSGSNYKANISF